MNPQSSASTGWLPFLVTRAASHVTQVYILPLIDDCQFAASVCSDVSENGRTTKEHLWLFCTSE